MFPGSIQLIVPNLISNGSAVFGQLMADSACILQYVLKCSQKKLIAAVNVIKKSII